MEFSEFLRILLKFTQKRLFGLRKRLWDILSNMTFSLYKKSGFGSELLNPARGHSYEFSRRFSGYFAKTGFWNENNYMEIEA